MSAILVPLKSSFAKLAANEVVTYDVAIPVLVILPSAPMLSLSVPWTLITAAPVPGVLKLILAWAFVPEGVIFKASLASGTFNSSCPWEWMRSLSVVPSAANHLKLLW